MTRDRYAIVFVLILFALLAAVTIVPLFVGVGVGAPWLALVGAVAIGAWWFWRRKRRQD